MKPYFILFLLCGVMLASGMLFAQGFDHVDFDRDGEVGFQDFTAFARLFGVKQGDPEYDRNFDVDIDGQIGFEDFLVFVRFFGQKRPDVGETLAVVLREAKVQLQAQGVESLPVAGFLDQLDAAADQDALVDIGGEDEQLSLEEVRFALGEPTLGDAVEDVLAQAKLQMAVSGDSVLALDALLALLDTEADRATLQELAGEDGQLSLGESKEALGDPVLSDSLAAALEDVRLQVKAANGEPVSIADILGGFSNEDLDALEAIAGEDKLVSLEEVTAALGDPTVSDALKAVLETARLEAEAAGETQVGLAGLLQGLSEADQTVLIALAGADSLMSLAEVTAVVGDPLLSDALKAILETAREKVTADGVPVSVDDLLGGISEADRAVLATLAGEDGQLSLGEVNAGLGDPVSEALAGALDQAKVQMILDGITSLPVDSLLSGVVDEADRAALIALAGEDGLLSLDETKAALGDPIVSNAVAAVLEDARLKVKAAGGTPLSVAELAAGLSDADRVALEALAGEDGQLSLGEAKAGLGDPVSEATAGVLDEAKAQMALGGLASVPIDALLAGLANEADQNVLKALAGDDGRLSMDEAKAALDDPVLSEAAAEVLEEARLQVKVAAGLPVPVADLVAGLSEADRAALEALAGEDGQLSLGEVKAGLGDPVSEAAGNALEQAKLRLELDGTASVSVADLAAGLSDTDQAVLKALAGTDGRLSSDEIKVGLGDPVLSEAGADSLDRAKALLQGSGLKSVPVADLVAGLSEADRVALEALAGADGQLSLAETKVGLGEPVGFILSGQIVDENEKGVLGVSVTLHLVEGSVVKTTVTDADGAYRFDNSADGDYELTPSAQGFVFEPPVREARVSGEDVTVLLFQKKQGRYAVSGRVSDRTSGRGVEGVVITLESGSITLVDSTDAEGRYRFSNLEDRLTYVVTPAATGFRFSPQDRSVKLDGGNVTVRGFRATPLTRPPVEETLVVDLPRGRTMEMVWIEAGTFKMGTLEEEGDRADREGPQLEVTIDQGFYLAKFEITQAQWESMMGTRPWEGQPFVERTSSAPAVFISWEDAQTFVNRLSAREGKEEGHYRLPTEAEWEFACRAGTEFPWSFGDVPRLLNDYAWYDFNAWNVGRRFAQRVGQKFPNPWGLYDMHGNVYEWVQDLSGPYTVEVGGRGGAPEEANAEGRRIIRSGSFASAAGLTRSGFRSSLRPTSRTYTVGFRVVKEGPPEGPVAAGQTPSSQPGGTRRQITGRVVTVRFSLPGGIILVDKTFISLPLGFLFPPTPVHPDSVSAFRSRGIPILREVDNIDGVRVTATRNGVRVGTVSTGGGQYAFPPFGEGVYEIAPSKPGYSFSPQTLAVALFGGNESVHFEGSRAGSVLGRITAGRGGLANVKMHLTGDRIDLFTTGGDGRFQFSNLPKGTYTVTPILKNFAFDPHTLTVRLGDLLAGPTLLVPDQKGVDFKAARDTIRTSGEQIVVTMPGSIPMEMAWVEAGVFKMGASAKDLDRYDQEQPEREVQIDKGFYLSKFEVTQQQWWRVMNTTPWVEQPFARSDTLQHPAMYVSWNDTNDFIRALNRDSEKDPNIIYRLPTEAEWEYVSRAGSDRKWSYGDDERQLKDYAWYEFNAWRQRRRHVSSVGARLPNRWGFYDMHGNVYEWVADWFAPYASGGGVRSGNTGPITGAAVLDSTLVFEPANPTRVIRGGSFASIARSTRSAFRTGLPPSNRSAQVGFRVVAELLVSRPLFKKTLSPSVHVFPLAGNSR